MHSVRTTALTLSLISGMTILQACNGWPVHSNLPEQSGDLVPSSEAPGDLISMEWIRGAEPVGDNNDPVKASELEGSSTTMAFGTGIIVTGALLAEEGRKAVGWSSNAETLTVVNDECGEPMDVAALPEEGFYIGDLDFFTIDIPLDVEEPILCATLETEAEALGWDLLLFQLDECNLPTEIIRVDGESSQPVGYGLGGELGSWSAPLTSASRWGLMVAGYDPPDDETQETTQPYRLAISLVHSGANNSDVVCPTLPAQEEGER